MSNLNSSVLVLKHPNPRQADFGADMVTNVELAITAIAQHSYQVVAIPLDPLSSEELQRLLLALNEMAPQPQRIYITLNPSLPILQTCLQVGTAFRILSSFDEPEFSETLQEALSEYALTQQNRELLQMVHDQHAQLKRLTVQLEGRVQKRETYLKSARERLLNTSQRIEALHHTLVAVHRAEAITDMEQLLNQAISKAMPLEWTRILFPNQSLIENDESLNKAHFTILSVPLMKNHDRIGQIYFGRPQTVSFSQSEEQFLLQVSNAVALAIDRLNQLENAENITHQWEGTFDAISTPVSLVDDHYNIVRANRAFALGSETSAQAVIGQKCYKIFFSRQAPCEGCFLGESFRITHRDSDSDREVKTMDVKSQVLPLKDPNKTYFVNFYKEVSEQLRMERQIVHSAKMAELGTIGSSIAHELNNPLGGLLSFIQIIKMDLKGGEPHFQDILEMEQGARRCKEIVQNLLDFSRQTNLDEQIQMDLRDIITQSIKITEIQTRSRGIVISASLPDTPIMVSGNATQLTQALRNLLQNANEAIDSRLQQESDFHGNIEVEVLPQGNLVQVVVSDNGQGISEVNLRRIFNPMFTTKDPNLNPGLGLTIARQIVAEHGGHLEISSQPRHRTRAILSLPVLKALD